jgi:two-component system phosphate regulon response regulator PhoB
MERVLIVDDDPDIQRLLSYNFRQAGFEAASAVTGRAALEHIERQRPDLIILDLMLPDIDGVEVFRMLRRRQQWRKIPVVMLTARGEEADRVGGFELGVDDYVSKPFSPRELVLRVQSILRRMKQPRSEMLRLANIRLYPDRRQCFTGSQQVVLTVKEFDLLHELMLAGGNVCTREVLMDKVWGYHGEAISRTLDTHVRRLRDKLGQEARHLETVRGIGYRMGKPAEDS